MSEEVAELEAPVEPVVDHPVLPETEIVTETPLEPTPETSVHPLQPGGRRFEQVYAQAKQAERERNEEREKRIRAEAQLELLNKTRTPAPKEYSVDELEAMVATGQITRADATRHREDVLKRSLAAELKNEQSKELALNTRLTTLSFGIQSYLNAVPDLNTPGTQVRARVDQEFDWLAGVQGKDPAEMSEVDRKALSLTALRNVLGDVKTLSTRTAAPNAEPHQGSVGGTPPTRKPNPDQQLLDKLTPREIAHYKREMSHGKYPGGWKDVVEELKFTPKRRS